MRLGLIRLRRHQVMIMITVAVGCLNSDATRINILIFKYVEPLVSALRVLTRHDITHLEAPLADLR